MKINIANTDDDLKKIIDLRYKILREPWNKPIETVSDELENKSVNAFIEDENGIIIACGRLQENENKVGQIRFMAVIELYQGKGLGFKILKFLEQCAFHLQLTKIELQARENAIPFYKKSGYILKNKSFFLWGIIQHYLMEKKL